MLRQAIEATGISPDRAAGLLGVSPKIFGEWLADQRPIPHSFVTLLNTVVGIELSKEKQSSRVFKEPGDVAPAMWYRFRGEKLVEQDRESIFLIRRLGHFINELEEITSSPTVGWKTLFQDIRNRVDRQAPPRVQGREAANMFRASRGLATGATGIGDVIRGNLRSLGLLVVESPLPESQLEGCCFIVGPQHGERPCIFTNTHHSTWFRRNIVLMHEVAHAIFDAESTGVTLDFHSEDKPPTLAEDRANAFAQESLIPRQVLQHTGQKHGIDWRRLCSEHLAHLVADTHVEAKTLLEVAASVGMISELELKTYMQLDISQILPSLSERALSAAEFIRLKGDTVSQWRNKRSTTIPARSLRLPTQYVKAVIETCQNGQISRGKAAEMLMIDDDTFAERFESVLGSADEP